MTEATRPRVHGIAPYFRVRSVVRAAEFYRDALGFTFDRYWGEPPCFCMVKYDSVILMLSEQEGENVPITPNSAHDEQWDAYLWTDNVEGFHERAKAHGAAIVYPPTLKEYYGNIEMAVRDPDGYIVAIGQDAG